MNLSRRNFFKKTAGAVVAVSVVPFLPKPKPPVTQRMCVIGLGRRTAIEQLSMLYGIQVLEDDGTYRRDYFGIPRG